MLLDGRNRRLACKLKNIPFKVVKKDFADEREALASLISANLRRLHLSLGNGGVRLLEGLEPAELELTRVIESAAVTHLRYRRRA